MQEGGGRCRETREGDREEIDRQTEREGGGGKERGGDKEREAGERDQREST